MFKPLPMLRADISLLKDDAPRMALLLAGFRFFAPEFTEIAPEQLPELSGEDYRLSYSESKSRLDKILEHFQVAIPEEPSVPMQPVNLSQLTGLGVWLKQTWAQCSDSQERMRGLREETRRTSQLLRALDRFKALNIDLARLQKKDALLDVRIGTLPLANLQRFQDTLALAGYVAIRFFTSADTTHLIIAGGAANKGGIERVLQSAGWRTADIPAEFQGQPSEIRKELTERMARLNELHAKEDGQRREQAARPDFVARLTDASRMLARAAPCAELALMMRGRGHLVTVSGWIPVYGLKHLQRLLEKNLPGRFVLSARDPRPDERMLVPSLISHVRWMKPFSSLVLNYGVPRYGEIDPTILFAVTFVLMFGMMFGDVGQGAIIALAGVLFHKRLGHYTSLVLAAGTCSCVFGLLYGSVFGYEHVIPAWWMSPLSDPSLMLSVALGWGCSFIVLANLLTIRNRLADGRTHEALLDSRGAAGLLLYLGLLLGAWRLYASGHIGIVAPLMMCTALAAIFSHTWRKYSGSAYGERLLMVLMEGLETAMAYTSNTLSFLRLAAFSLNHVALAVAIFTVANMLHTTGYWVTVVLGNIFILVLEGAIVAIQALRLEYYEGFSRFFEADGRPFRPLSLGAKQKLALQK